MTPLEKLRKAITDALAGVKASINTAIKGLPPVEQHEANTELAGGLRMMNYCATDLLREVDRIGGLITEDATVKAALADVSAETLEAEIKAGNLFRKADYEAAINAAKDGEKTAVTTALTAKFEQDLKAERQRGALLREVPAILAEKFPAEAILGDNATESITLFKGRFAKCAEVGVTPENSAAFCAEIAALPLDATGDAAFAEKLKPLQAVHAAKAGSGTGKPKDTPPNPAGGAAAPKNDDSQFL